MESIVENIINKIDIVSTMYYQLVLIIVSSGGGKTKALQEIGSRINAPLININLELSRRLLPLTNKQRVLQLKNHLASIVNESESKVVHYCPTVLNYDSCNIVIYNGLQRKRGVIDLKSGIYYSRSESKKRGAANECKKNSFLTNNGLFSISSISKVYKTISGKLQDAKVFLLRSISVYGICSIDISGKSEGHRSLFAFKKREVISFRYSGQHIKKHIGIRKRNKGLAYLC